MPMPLTRCGWTGWRERVVGRAGDGPLAVDVHDRGLDPVVNVDHLVLALAVSDFAVARRPGAAGTRRAGLSVATPTAAANPAGRRSLRRTVRRKAEMTSDRMWPPCQRRIPSRRHRRVRTGAGNRCIAARWGMSRNGRPKHTCAAAHRGPSGAVVHLGAACRTVGSCGRLVPLQSRHNVNGGGRTSFNLMRFVTTRTRMVGLYGSYSTNGADRGDAGGRPG